jgi:hypothetical protein
MAYYRRLGALVYPVKQCRRVATGNAPRVMDENRPMWRSERITLNSVGIDIGSSNSQLIFARVIQGDPDRALYH